MKTAKSAPGKNLAHTQTSGDKMKDGEIDYLIDQINRKEKNPPKTEGWVLIIESRHLTDEQKRLIKNYLWKKHIIHSGMNADDWKSAITSLIDMQQLEIPEDV